MEEGMEENISNEYISTAQLAESEWAKYHNHLFCSLGNYAFYEDILILKGSMEYEVYQRDEKRWKKKGTLQLELPHGAPEQFEAYQKRKITERFISHFAIREDGTIVVIKREDDGEVEYWLWKKMKQISGTKKS